MKIPQNFIDPEQHEQDRNYSNPVWSRSALLELIKYNGQHTTKKELLHLYKGSYEQQDALSFRIKAMIRDGQLIAVDNVLYLPSFFPIRKGVIIQKNNEYMVRFLEDGSIVNLNLSQSSKSLLYPGDIADFYYIEKKSTAGAHFCKMIKAHDIYVEGYIESAREYDVPARIKTVLSVTSGPYCDQVICLHPSKTAEKLKNNAKVIAKLDRDSASNFIFATVSDQQCIANNDIMNIITQYHLPFTWSDEIVSQSEKISSTVRKISTHEDLTDLNFVTIDGQTAKDFDDAVFARKVEDGFDLYVAIADVSSYVQPKSPIDIEAAKRGVSTYFPGFVIPMLPEKLSNDLCSLRPQRLRKTLTCIIHIRKNKVHSYRFTPAVIRSKARLTYEQVEENKVPKKLQSDIDNLWSVYKTLAKIRKKKGYLSFETKSPFFSFNNAGKVHNITYTPSLESCKLIEEMMLCANVCAAKFLEKSFNNHGVFRIHPAPLEEKVDSLNDFLKFYGVSLTPPYTMESIEEFSDTLKDKVPQLSGLTSRLMQRAIYQTTPELHFGLNEEAYTHFTSPIRRYPDLIVHRLIYKALHQKNKEPTDFMEISEQLSEVNFLERRAEEAERFYHQILKTYFASTLKKKKLKATITALTSFGFFVECDNYPVEGLVHFKSANLGYCELQDGIVYSEAGKSFILGQSCYVSIESVDLENYRINFTLLK